MKLYYFNAAGRQLLALVLLEVSNISYEWVKIESVTDELRQKSPFGQVPFLEDGDIFVGQSMAIARYVSRKGGLEGEGKDFAISEMLIEEQTDITNLMVNVFRAEDKKEQWKKYLENDLPKHYGNLEKLLSGDFFGSKLTAGDLAIWSVSHLIFEVNPELFDQFPKFKAHFDRIGQLPGVQKVKDLNLSSFLKKLLSA
eukprot:TRINITY_DN4157_c0_g1_i1.p2 TRINITY_DN4157_c0_g1~~TRINITY_DN4157_c0_g1_i1.p2  ORF type:complete len:217 (-),score=98.47 TRINITY_DN4157_c0_g1_i1:100-693(-)